MNEVPPKWQFLLLGIIELNKRVAGQSSAVPGAVEQTECSRKS